MIVPTKVAYICHPISGNVGYNVRQVRRIMREIYSTEPDVVPFAPYLTTLEVLEESNPEQRRLGIESNKLLIRKNFIDEVRLYGNKLSSGMKEEVILFMLNHVKVYAMTPETLDAIVKLTSLPKENFLKNGTTN